MRKMSESDQGSSSDDDQMPTRRVAQSDLFTKKGVPLADQQIQLKDEFKRQAGMTGNSDSEELLVKKPVQPQSDEEPVQQKKPAKKEAKLVTDKELLARFFGQDSELNAEDKFLRSYILNEGWKEAGGKRLTKDKEVM